MTRKPTPVPRPPALVAIERMAKLASSGATATRMVDATAAVIQEWLAEDLPVDEMRDRLETLQADLDGGITAIEDAQGDAETDGQRRSTQAQKDALAAARDAIMQAIERLGP